MEAFFIIFAVALAVLAALYSLSLSVRRWHDLGYTGLLVLLQLIPLVNLVLFIYLFFAKGDEGPNAYGMPNVGQPLWRSIFASDSLAKQAAVSQVHVQPAPTPAQPFVPAHPVATAEVPKRWPMQPPPPPPVVPPPPTQ